MTPNTTSRTAYDNGAESYTGTAETRLTQQAVPTTHFCWDKSGAGAANGCVQAMADTLQFCNVSRGVQQHSDDITITKPGAKNAGTVLLCRC